MTVIAKSRATFETKEYANIKKIEYNSATREYRFTNENDTTYNINGVAWYVFILLEQ